MGKDKIKVCGICGECWPYNWQRHWKRMHTTERPWELKDGDLPIKYLRINWSTKIPDDIKKLYPKTLARLGGSTAQKNPAEKMKSLKPGE